MHVILLRHTRTAIGSSVCYGDQDVPLASSSAEDIQSVVKTLPTFTAVLSSPLSRCHRLAQSAAALYDLPVELDDQLKEMHFGAWQGMAWDDVPRSEVDEWALDFEHAKPHGGESVAGLRARLRSFLSSLEAQSAQEDRVLVVSHAGVIRSI
ncbi:MAG: alpha-ribazole phosphatase, partial [Candidatus Azotimanducaceae bacterium]